MKNTLKILTILIAIVLFITTVAGALAVAPEIQGTIPDMIKGEDASAWELDLSIYESAVEEGETQVWSFEGVDSSIVSVSYNRETHKASFTLVENANGADVITFKLKDSESLSATQIVTLTVNAENDAPVLQDLPSQIIVDGVSKEVELSSYATDVDEDTLTWSISEKDATKVNCLIDQSGKLTMSNDQSFNVGSSTCKVKIDDGVETAEKTVSITVQAESKTVTAGTITMDAWARTASSNAKGEIEIENTGNVVLSGLTFEASDLSYGTVGTILKSKISFNPSSISTLDVGAKQKVTVTASGLASDQTLGTYTGTISVKQGDTTLTTQTLNLIVRDPTAEFTAEGTLQMPQVDRNETAQLTFDVTNSGDFDLTEFAITNDADSDYNVRFSPYSNTFVKGETKTLTAHVDITEDAKAGEYEIGDVKLSAKAGTITVEKTISLRVDVETMLEITDLDIEVVDEGTHKNVDDGDEIGEKPRPGDEVIFTFKVENKFDKDSEQDYDIDEIQITITIDDIGDEDIEEESDSFDLSPEEESDEQEIRIRVPSDAKEKTYDVEILVEGEDEEGVEHTIEWTLELDVERNKHDIIISSYEITPQSVRIGGNAYIDVTVKNVGSNTEKYARLTALESTLGIDYVKSNIRLDEDPDESDNDYHISIPVTVLKTVTAGDYNINLKLFYDGDKPVDGENVKLTVLPALATQIGNDAGNDDNDDQDDQNVIQPPTTLEDTSKESGLEGQTWYVTILIILIVVIIVLIVFLFGKFLK